MDELFNILSSSARIDKSKRGNKRKRAQPRIEDDDQPSDEHDDDRKQASRDRTGKRDTSQAKQQQVHKEQVAAFRRSMSIRLANKHDADVPDPLSSFDELQLPPWWKHETTFSSLVRPILQNIESGKWKEPTPIQMQCIPTLLARRDVIGNAPTGSGKSGAFVIPALLLSSAPFDTFYASKVKASDKKKPAKPKSHEGEIRSLLLAPSRELAAQLHREVERLGTGKPGGLTSLLLSKSNASHIISGSAGGKRGLDVLVTTPMRLVDSIEKGLDLNSLRLVVLDEADRLLDATDHARQQQQQDKNDSESSEEEEGEPHLMPASGSTQSQSFLSQMDIIFSATPATATRALFSATVTPMVRSLAESILRNPVDVTIAAPGTMGGANTDIDQQLMFVGREEGKLLAMRQLLTRGQLRPPAIVFVQSQERAQALFGELLYDGMHVDVIHAGRSRTARDNAVAKFRRGDTWVLICTDLCARGVDFRAVNMVINYDLPTSGITYVHRIGRTGRAGRKGKAITLFTEADFENLRTIANVMKQSGCDVPEWMLNLKRKKSKSKNQAPRRPKIDTTPGYDKAKRMKKKQSIENSKKKKALEQQKESS